MDALLVYGSSFASPKITSILDFKGLRDRIGYHINYEESSAIHNILISRSLVSDHPVDISVGTQRMFIFLDFTHHQIVGDTREPLL